MTPADKIKVLKSARVLVERGWTQNANCRNARGQIIDLIGGRTPDGDYTPNADARAWCALGALVSALLAETGKAHWGSLMARLSEAVGEGIERWNDREGRTQAEVLAAFDRAIDLQEAPTR